MPEGELTRPFQLTKVTRLHLRDFRNFSEVELHPSPEGLTVVSGPNATGKTSLLEALAYCSTLKSFRGVQRDSLIRQGALVSLVSCDLMCGSRSLDIRVLLELGRRDQVTMNGQRVARARDLANTLRTTLFSPDDLEVVKGGPSGRRDLLDDAIATSSPQASADRSELERILRQRNTLLRQLAGRLRKEDELTLDIWDERLAEAGERVAGNREELVMNISPHVSAAWVALAGSSHPLRLRYQRSFDGRLIDSLRTQRPEDLRRQMTTVGPQRDELLIESNGLDARTRLSQGRQRCAALALRLGVHRYVRQATGCTPVLLLDDAFSELDEATSRALVTELPEGQSLLTTAGPLPPGAVPNKVVSLAGGSVTEQHG